MKDDMQTRQRRWRLLLGSQADSALGQVMRSYDRKLDAALDAVYGEHTQGHGFETTGGNEASGLDTINLLERLQKLFPTDIYHKLQKDSIEKYGLDSLLTSKSALEKIKPDKSLLKSILNMRGKTSLENLHLLRSIVKQVVDELRDILKPQIEKSLSGSKILKERSFIKNMRNFDFKRTIAKNLKNYVPELKTIIPSELYFTSRSRDKHDKTILLVVDQSGSMTESLIFSAIAAGILYGIPKLHVKLILFDTSVVDLSHIASDPVEVLLQAQLGGGTYISQALEYAFQLVKQPAHSHIILISDFFEGAPLSNLINVVKDIIGSGIKISGLTAITNDSEPIFNAGITSLLQDEGMNISSVSPSRFARWLGDVLQ